MRVAINIGVSALSNKGGTALTERVSLIVASIMEVWSSDCEMFIVTSGAPMWGSALVRQDELKIDVPNGYRGGRSRLKHQLFSSVGQCALSAEYADCFRKCGRNVSQILVTRQDLADQQRYESIKWLLLNAMRHEIMPLVNTNDVLIDPESESEFRSNDELSAILAAALHVDLLVMVTDDDGLRERASTGDGVGYIRELDVSEKSYQIQYGTPRDGVKAAINAARMLSGFGIEMVVANGTRAGFLKQILAGDFSCTTRIRSKGTKLKQRKSWVALAAQSRGEVCVSVFLAEILRDRRPASVLMIGVESVRGGFRKSDVVTVKDLSGNVLGRGEVRVSAAEAIAFLNGDSCTAGDVSVDTELIHYDYFVHAPQQL